MVLVTPFWVCKFNDKGHKITIMKVSWSGWWGSMDSWVNFSNGLQKWIWLQSNHETKSLSIHSEVSFKLQILGHP